MGGFILTAEIQQARSSFYRTSTSCSQVQMDVIANANVRRTPGCLLSSLTRSLGRKEQFERVLHQVGHSPYPLSSSDIDTALVFLVTWALIDTTLRSFSLGHL